MKKTRLLLLLALLLTAATGAWAQDAKHLITATYVEKTRSLEQPLPYATTIGALYEAVTGEPFSDLLSRMSALEMPLKGISSTKTDVVSIGEFNGASTPVTVKADGKATIGLKFGNYVQGIFVNVVPPLYVTMKDGVKDADKWTASTDGTNFGALPIGGLKGDGTETVTLKYNGRLKVKGVKATSDAKPDAWDGDLAKLTAESTAEFATATDGMTISGRLAANVKVSIADGATVTLDGVTIGGDDDENYKWAGLNCLGDATIILKDGTENTVRGFYRYYPGIHVPAGSRLTITGGTEGNGTLTATSSGYGAGIGGGYEIHCGNIYIQGGYIRAMGGMYGAGIGGGPGAICDNITISGGTVRAMGGPEAAGIGGGSHGRCGNITITNGVNRVEATKGGEEAPYSIGAGNYGSCVTVAIGGTVYWQDNAAVGDGATYLGQSLLFYMPRN